MTDIFDLTDGEIIARIWRELERAGREPDHPWRTPVVASVDSRGLPQARTVVLRRVDAGAGTLAFYTHSGSPKVAQLESGKRALMVFWSRELGWQLRVGGAATVQADGCDVEGAWQQLAGSPGALDYLAPVAPGTPLDQSGREIGGDHRLAIVTVAVDAIDWLALRPSGHRRASISGGKLTWLVP